MTAQAKRSKTLQIAEKGSAEGFNQVKKILGVTTPQSLASMVVRKAVHMVHIVAVNIIGIIENMAYYRCPDTD